MMLEKMFEGLLVESHFVTTLLVIFGLVEVFILFFIVSCNVLKAISFTYQYFFTSGVEIDPHEDAVGLVTGATDLYLAALVLFIFSFGVCEPLISEIEGPKQTKQSKILEVHNLDQLKGRLAKVTTMALVVNFLQRVLRMKFTTPMDMAYLAGSILALCIEFYSLYKGGH